MINSAPRLKRSKTCLRELCGLNEKLHIKNMTQSKHSTNGSLCLCHVGGDDGGPHPSRLVMWTEVSPRDPG